MIVELTFENLYFVVSFALNDFQRCEISQKSIHY